MGSVFAANNVV